MKKIVRAVLMDWAQTLYLLSVAAGGLVQALELGLGYRLQEL
jgi:hypothetical protein